MKYTEIWKYNNRHNEWKNHENFKKINQLSLLDSIYGKKNEKTVNMNTIYKTIENIFWKIHFFDEEHIKEIMINHDRLSKKQSQKDKEHYEKNKY